jgi:uncharacterized lipoprotein YddW (UPF0748 family)
VKRPLWLLVLASCQAAPSAPETRAIWVTRFDYRTEEDVRTIVGNCASLRANAILFQVRGSCDAYYRSEIEPRAEGLAGDFDPLATALAEAKKRGIALHAWINVLPAWRGKEPPADEAHVWHRRPDWILVGRDGEPQALNEHYVALNPMLPEVRAHVAKVAAEIAAKYAVDGIHLDYIRFYTDDGKDYSYDERSLALFGMVSGGTPDAKPELWSWFRRECVTETVREIRKAVRVPLSAAVFPGVEGRRKVHQDAERWAREGLVDALYPMAYAADGEKFRGYLEESRFAGAVTTRDGEPLRARGPRVRVVPGVGVFRHATAEETARQLAAVRSCALFAYASFFASRDGSAKDADELRAARARAVRDAWK